MADFDESKAPYSERASFITLWNEMCPERRMNNLGLFVKILGRTPSDRELANGISITDPLTQVSGE